MVTFVAELREIAQNVSGRRSAIDGRTTRHAGYAVSLRIRKRIEEAFGWAKTVAGLRKARHRSLPKIDWQFTFTNGRLQSRASAEAARSRRMNPNSVHNGTPRPYIQPQRTSRLRDQPNSAA